MRTPSDRTPLLGVSLRGTARRAALCLGLTCAVGAAVAAPALASSHSPSARPAGHSDPAQLGTSPAAVEIGTAVQFTRDPDGSIRQTR
ncbi:MAG: hypothetical protein NVSMB13_17590 [Mycobacteriales bacterium]